MTDAEFVDGFKVDAGVGDLIGFAVGVGVGLLVGDGAGFFVGAVGLV